MLIGFWSLLLLLLWLLAYSYTKHILDLTSFKPSTGFVVAFVSSSIVLWSLGVFGLWYVTRCDCLARCLKTASSANKDTQRDLQQSRQQFRILFESMWDGVLVVDPETRKIILANPAICASLGIPPHEMADLHLEDIDPLSQTNTGLVRLVSRVCTEGGGDSVELPIRTQNEQDFQASISASLMTLDNQLLVALVVRNASGHHLYEKALQESEARFRMLFDNMRGGAALYRAIDEGEDFELVDMSKPGLKLCAIDRDEVLGKRISELRPEFIDVGILGSMKDVWLSGISHDISIAVTDGTCICRWFENHIFRLPSGLVAILFEDTSGERAVHAALRESEAHHRHMVEAIPDILYRYSFSKGIVYVSPQVRGILGFDPLGSNKNNLWQESVYPDDQEMVRQSYAKVTRGQRFDIEYRIFDVQGELHWFRDRSITCQVQDGDFIVEGIATDITERKKAESEQELLSRVIEQSREIVLITNASGEIQYVNSAFEQATGYSRDEILGENPRILKSGIQDDEFYREMWSTLTAGQTWEGRVINKKKDGTLFTEETSITPVLDVSRRVTHYVAAKRDITEHLALQEEKNKIEEQYRQSQKMEAIGQLAGGVAHDFNNLLQVINGYTDLANENIDPDSPARKSLGHVLKAGDRAALLVRQLLAFSRRQTMNPENLNVGGLVNELLKMLERVIGEHIRLEFTQEENLHTVRADRGMLEQVLLNLCVNARDAMPIGGIIFLGVHNSEIDENFKKTHPWATPGKYVCLSVADTGCGIPDEVKKRLFEPFFTTKATGEGTGLGLAMVYGIVKQHGGVITCESKLGEGSTFNIYLPQVSGKVAKGRFRPDDDAPGGNETILVVEDDKMVRELGRSILERAGYTVITAEDGLDAILCFQDHKDEIDLVLMDVVMPNMGGREAYEHMQIIKPGTPTLFASGYSESSFKENFLSDNKLRLIEKPFSRKVMLRAIREVLEASRIGQSDACN